MSCATRANETRRHEQPCVQASVCTVNTSTHTLALPCLALPARRTHRLLPEVAGAVLQAAIESGVARLTDIDIVQYKRQLADLAVRTSM